MGKRHLKIKQKISLGMIIILLLFSVIIAAGGYKIFTKILLNVYFDNSISIARASQSICSNYDVSSYSKSCQENGNELLPEYKIFHESIVNLCNDMGATFIYIITPDQTDYKHITFDFSCAGKNSGKTPFNAGYVRNTTNVEYEKAYRRLIEGKSEYEIVIRDKGLLETGHHITTLIPLKETGHSSVSKLIAVELPMKYLYVARKDYLLMVLMVTVLADLIIYFALQAFIQKILVNKIIRISNETVRFSKENTISENNLVDILKTLDEIGYLADSVTDMEHQIVNHIKNITAITAEKERAETQLKIAAAIQLGALPKPIALGSIDLYATMQPAFEVGGDFYDFFKIDDKHIALVIADVSGKGVPAALFMMISKIILRKNFKAGMSPAEVLSATNQELCEENPEEMFVTCFCGILDLETNIFTYSNAGHEKPALMKKDSSFKEKVKEGVDVRVLYDDIGSISTYSLHNIKELNKDIASTKESIKKLINSYELLQGDNIYLEYIFEAQTYADLIYRFEVVNQILGYNNSQIESWNEKVIYNEQLQVDLAKQEEELNNKISSLEKEIDSLGTDLEKISDITMDIQEQIDGINSLIKYYEGLGCKDNQDLNECVSVKGDTGFRKPLIKGTITSYFGYRIHPITGKNNFHSGTDIGGNPEGTNVYATANGVVGMIIDNTSKKICGGRQVYIYHTINGKKSINYRT